MQLTQKLLTLALFACMRNMHAMHLDNQAPVRISVSFSASGTIHPDRLASITGNAQQPLLSEEEDVASGPYKKRNLLSVLPPSTKKLIIQEEEQEKETVSIVPESNKALAERKCNIEKAVLNAFTLDMEIIEQMDIHSHAVITNWITQHCTTKDHAETLSKIKGLKDLIDIIEGNNNLYRFPDNIRSMPAAAHCTSKGIKDCENYWHNMATALKASPNNTTIEEERHPESYYMQIAMTLYIKQIDQMRQKTLVNKYKMLKYEAL